MNKETLYTVGIVMGALALYSATIKAAKNSDIDMLNKLADFVA